MVMVYKAEEVWKCVINPLKTKSLLNDRKSSSYLTGNTLRLHCEDQVVNDVYCEDKTKHKHTPWAEHGILEL
jgi:hypothetical protein